MERINPQQYIAVLEERKKTSPKSEHAELIDNIIKMTGDKNYPKWCGRTKHLSLPKLRHMVSMAESGGKPPSRLFNYLLGQSRV